MTITPATAALDAANVPYRVLPYEHNPAAESFGLEAAAVLGLDPMSVFKTLMAQLDTGELVVAIVPVSGKLDLKGLAKCARAKKASMADPAAAQRSSGYVLGGISPFGQRRPLATYVDETIALWDEIYVSGGRRGLDIGLAGEDLVALLDATVGPIAIG